MKRKLLLFVFAHLAFVPLFAQGTITTIAGTGTASYTGDGGAAITASISNPAGIVVDTAGNIFFADYDNHVVRMIEKTTGIITTIAGNNTSGYSGDGGPATAASFVRPQGLAIDNLGNLYVADPFNYVVRKVNIASGLISTIAGTGAYGYSGDGAAATDAKLSVPVGVYATPSGIVYISDYGSNTIRKIDLSGNITTVAGNGVRGSAGDGGLATDASLNRPKGVCVDDLGNIYISDGDNHKIRKVDHATEMITTIAGSTVTGYSGDGGPATDAQLSVPIGLYVDVFHNVYFADVINNAIRKINYSTGVINTIAGTGTSGYSGDGGDATAAKIWGPNSVCINKTGDLFVTDAGNNRIRKVALGSLNSVIPNKKYVSYSVFPNPFKDNITIDLAKGNEKISILDISGKEVYNSSLIGQLPQTTLQLKNLSSGTYFMLISNSDQNLQEIKLIKE